MFPATSRPGERSCSKRDATHGLISSGIRNMAPEPSKENHFPVPCASRVHFLPSSYSSHLDGSFPHYPIFYFLFVRFLRFCRTSVHRSCFLRGSAVLCSFTAIRGLRVFAFSASLR